MTKRTIRRLILGVIAVPMLALAGLFAWAAINSAGVEFKEPAVTLPLQKLSVTQHYGKTVEVFATLAQGVRLESAVNLSLFEGFEPSMTLDQAKARLGPPSGEWDDPFCRAVTSYYDRPAGKVSLCQYGTEYGGKRWDTVAFPRNCTHQYVFRELGLPQQIAPWLVRDEAVTVHILRQVGTGGASVKMTAGGCSWIVLAERE